MFSFLDRETIRFTSTRGGSRIFFGWGANPPGGTPANIWFHQILQKKAWNWENFGPHIRQCHLSKTRGNCCSFKVKHLYGLFKCKVNEERSSLTKTYYLYAGRTQEKLYNNWTKGILSLSERGNAADRRKGRQWHGQILCELVMWCCHLYFSNLKQLQLRRVLLFSHRLNNKQVQEKW